MCYSNTNLIRGVNKFEEREGIKIMKIEPISLEVNDLNDDGFKAEFAKMKAKNGDPQAIRYLEEQKQTEDFEERLNRFREEENVNVVEERKKIREKKLEKSPERAPLPEEQFLSMVISDMTILDKYKLNSDFFSNEDAKKLYKALVKLKTDGYGSVSYKVDNGLGNINIPTDFTFSMDAYPTFVASQYYNGIEESIEGCYDCLKANYMKRICKNNNLQPSSDKFYQIYDDATSDLMSRLKEIEDAYAFAKDTYNPFTLYTLDTLPDTDKNRGWFIEDMIQEESFNIIVGPAKSGKSAFSYGMAYCLQNGINFLDKKVEQCDVLYLDFEIDTRDIKIRLERLKKYYGDDTKSFNIMPLIKNNFEFDYTLQKIKNILRKNTNIKIVFWDNFYSFFTGNQNDATDVKKVLSAIRNEITGVSNIVICHANKANGQSGGSEDPLYAASGSAVFGNYAEQLISIKNKDDGKIVSVSGRSTELYKIECAYGANTNYMFKKLGFVHEIKNASPDELKNKYPDICNAIGEDGINAHSLLRKFPNETITSLKEKGFYYSGKNKRNDKIPSNKFYICKPTGFGDAPTKF